MHKLYITAGNIRRHIIDWGEVIDLVLAYILAKVEAGKDNEILKEIRKISGINKTSSTYGIYDLFIEVDFKTVEELDEFVFDKLRKIPGVKETVTMVSSQTSV